MGRSGRLISAASAALVIAAGHSMAFATSGPLHAAPTGFAFSAGGATLSVLPLRLTTPIRLTTPSGRLSVVQLGVAARSPQGTVSGGSAVTYRETGRQTATRVVAKPGGGLETFTILDGPTAPTTFRWRIWISGAVERLERTPDGGVNVVRIAERPAANPSSPVRRPTTARRAGPVFRGHAAPMLPPPGANGNPVLAPPEQLAPCPARPGRATSSWDWSTAQTGGTASLLEIGSCLPRVGQPTIPVALDASPASVPTSPRRHAPTARLSRVRQEVVVAHVMPPTSRDQRGTEVPTAITISGDQLIVHVDLHSGRFAYPVTVDPQIVGEDATQPCSSLVQAGTFQGRGMLVRNCKVWLPVGFNDYRLMNYAAGLPHPFVNSTTENEGCGPILDSEDQDSELHRIAESGANVVRVWFFQKYYQDFADDSSSTGLDPWGPYVHLLQAAKAHGLLVIPVLTNNWDQCDREPSTGTTSPSNDGNHAAYGFYENGPGGASPGYLTAGTYGYTYSAKDWASMVASEFGPNGSHSDLTSTIAFYQVINEAEVDSTTTDTADCGPDAPSALYSFGNDMGGAIKAQYAGHTAPLVSLGTMGIGQCGVSSDVADPVSAPSRSDFAYIHSAPNIDICEVHDYDAESVSDPSVDWYGLPHNNMAERLDECPGKPLIVGEAGIEANVQSGDVARSDPGNPSPPSVSATTLSRRARYLSRKLATDFNAGVAGYVLWDKIQAGSDSSWNKSDDETLGYGSYGVRTSGVRHQDPSICIVQDVANGWVLGDAPPDVPSQSQCDAQVPPPSQTDHYAFVDGTSEGWSIANTWGDLTVSTATGHAPDIHPASDSANHALKLTIGSNQTPAVEIESDSVALLQPGDTISMWVYRPGSANVGVSPLLRLGNGWTSCPGQEVRIPNDGHWHLLTMTVPTSTSGLGCLGGGTPSNLDVHAVGLFVEDDNPWGSGSGQSIYLDDVAW
jgi:hypothetical protein